MDDFFVVAITILVICSIMRIFIYLYAINQWRMDKREEALKEELRNEFNRENT